VSNAAPSVPVTTSAITPLILTLNEADNVGRMLDALRWAARIVVVDSGSTDGTLEILARNPAVHVLHRTFDDHTTQWNHGLDQIVSEWVLTLDADYVVTDEFTREMFDVTSRAATDGYWIPFRYCMGGRPLRASLYPPRLALFRTAKGRYVADGHTQRLRLNGVAARMQAFVHHDDRKPLSRWLEAQQRYAMLEVAKLQQADPRHLSLNDRLRRRSTLAPMLVFLYCLFGRGLILEGRPGFQYALQRLYAETLLALRLSEQPPPRKT
jgi:glycosyltransferase involved in cell wall biosynthesis